MRLDFPCDQALKVDNSSRQMPLPLTGKNAVLSSGVNMLNLFKPKLGTEKRPIIIRVQNEQRAGEVASICKQHDWKFIAGLEPDKPEDISDLEKALCPPFAQHTKPSFEPRIGKNDYCPCGSNLKFKKCCGKSKS